MTKTLFNLIFVALILWVCGSPLRGQSPASIEKELSGYLTNISKYGTYGGNYDGKKNSSNNAALRQKLIRYGKRADVLKYSFPRLEDNMYVATSKDGRLRIYSWDTETGGTMHDFDKVYQYRGKSGKVYSWTAKVHGESGAGTFCQEIFEADVTGGPIYLPVCTFIGSTSLAGQFISTVRITGETLDTKDKSIKTATGIRNSINFAYDFFSVVDHPERPIKLFFFDEAKKSFRFPIVIEDDKSYQGRVTDQFITYTFDGKYFVKTS